MKKSLVITTIATVLVIVVALTTATFAWFSASSVTTVNNSFAVSASESAVSIYQWKPAEGATVGEYNASPLFENWALGLGSEYEWEYSGVSSSGNASTAYNLLMPNKEILGTEFAANTGVTADYDGLPSVPFIKATAGEDSATVTAVDQHPVAVRFRLMAGKTSMKIKATVTISVAAGATTKDFLAAQATRVVLIGKTESAATETTPNIMLVTNYYYTDTAGLTAGSKEPAVPASTLTTDDYTLTSYQDVATGTNLVKVLNPASITSTTSTSATAELEFAAEPTNALNCVLYIWFDGGVASDSAALGNVTINIDFSEVQP